VESTRRTEGGGNLNHGGRSGTWLGKKRYRLILNLTLILTITHESKEARHLALEARHLDFRDYSDIFCNTVIIVVNERYDLDNHLLWRHLLPHTFASSYPGYHAETLYSSYGAKMLHCPTMYMAERELKRAAKDVLVILLADFSFQVSLLQFLAKQNGERAIRPASFCLVIIFADGGEIENESDKRALLRQCMLEGARGWIDKCSCKNSKEYVTTFQRISELARKCHMTLKTVKQVDDEILHRCNNLSGEFVMDRFDCIEAEITDEANKRLALLHSRPQSAAKCLTNPLHEGQRTSQNYRRGKKLRGGWII
jgi:hypothetical protein